MFDFFQEASSILETIYGDYANSAQKAYLIQEFYGADFAFFKVKEQGISWCASWFWLMILIC